MGQCTMFFWRAVLAEFLGTTIFLYLLCGVTLTWNANVPATITQISLSIGFSIGVLVHIFGSASGGHFNPAVTIGLFVGRRIPILRTLFYLIAQCSGALTGVAICYATTPSGKRGILAVATLANGVNKWQGFAVEGILTFFLVMTVLASSDPNRNEKGFGPALAIGVAVTVCHMNGIPYTSCGINPARVLGPAVVMNHWPNYNWIYWAGPIAGAIIAGIVYSLVFEIQEETSVELTPLDYILEGNFPSGKARATIIDNHSTETATL